MENECIAHIDVLRRICQDNCDQDTGATNYTGIIDAVDSPFPVNIFPNAAVSTGVSVGVENLDSRHRALMIHFVKPVAGG